MDAHSLLESNHLLIAITNEVKGELGTFEVHYWAGNELHFSNKPHKHTFYEIFYVIAGEGVYAEGNVQHGLKSGTLFCSRPGIMHQIISENGLFVLFIGFEIKPASSSAELNAKYQELESSDKVICYDSHETLTVLMWKTLLHQAALNTKGDKDNFIRDLAYHFILSIPDNFKQQKIVPVKRKIRRLRDNTLAQAMTYIGDNMASNLSLNDVANYVHLSPRHLSRLFFEERGQSFSNFIRKTRLEKAIELLVTTNLPVKLIAEIAGFKTIHYFTRIFSKEMKMTPTFFRKKQVV
ncbi:AraC family transcriptional regulator [Paenibacillus radicis (ex Xue et al. 2023)]|uniref:AraC family transcriptional regulator n=1 Tax=Paenibacillus radicis (ex Xue et al. 2023) TaxID=2972489 RepID=A0ABT1YIL6_9BACL|nr:AraC family transcriptional regulator [Paenibacillus radicis (ex Xue et al. 2023)]MCR8633026.1 AraC family transcriptional regulator [Paenibacillus radicis (ex Xue et al. 2023)]